jgi:hypothetical protein
VKRLFKFLPILGFVISSVSADTSPTPQANGKKEDLDVPLPIGIPVNGIKIPHYNEEGKLVLVMQAESAKKTDDSHIEMSQLRVEAIDVDGQRVFVNFPHANFDMDTRILTGDKSAEIKRDDFTATGDSIEFNTQTRFGKMRGNIFMTIQSEQISK